MNKLISTFIGLIFLTQVFADDSRNAVKVSVFETTVPADVVVSFDRTHVTVEARTWYPYPYRFSAGNDLTNSKWFSAALNLSTTPDFYEVEFVKNDVKTRKIYDLNGDCEQEIEVLNLSHIPEELSAKLVTDGYTQQDLLSYEILKGCRSSNFMFHKVLVKSSSMTKVFYYNENYLLEKSREWEVGTKKTKEGAVDVKTAYQGLREKVEVQDLTWDVRLKLKNDFKSRDILEFWEVEPVHVPQQREELEYYDIQLSPVYEVVYKGKNAQLLKNTYNSYGELLETVELLSLADAPSYVGETVKGDSYEKWSIKGKVEKVKLTDGNYCYRIHGIVDGDNQVFVVLKK